jgi:hypothetical protein
MNRFLRTTGFAASCLAAFLMIGGHWAMLQSVAWAQMVGDFLSRDPLGTALVKTFDGRHPCVLCLKIRAGRQQEGQEQKLPLLTQDRTPDLFCDTRQVTVPTPPTSAAAMGSVRNPFCADFTDSPPTPPPRRG